MQGGILVRNVRLACGLILMAFVTCHLANLILGIRSLQTMEDWRPFLMGPWRSLPGIVLLGTAALVHAMLGLHAISARRSLGFSRTDVVQLFLGVITPPLLLGHAVAMYTAGRVTPDFPSTFGQTLAIYWSFAPSYAFQQLAVVMVVWMHAAIGLYSWLVLKPAWRRVGGLVLPLLFAIPILALIGFAEAGKEVLAKLEAEPAWRSYIIANLGKVARAAKPLEAIQAQILVVYGVLVALAFGFFGARLLRDRMSRVRVAYDGGLFAEGRRSLSILELSLAADVPHAHVCSGRARCGTCRVRVDAGAGQLTPMEEVERRTLERSGARPGERLACQARVLGDGVAVTRLLPAYADASAARDPQEWVEQRGPA